MRVDASLMDCSNNLTKCAKSLRWRQIIGAKAFPCLTLLVIVRDSSAIKLTKEPLLIAALTTLLQYHISCATSFDGACELVIIADLKDHGRCRDQT